MGHMRYEESETSTADGTREKESPRERFFWGALKVCFLLALLSWVVAMIVSKRQEDEDRQREYQATIKRCTDSGGSWQFVQSRVLNAGRETMTVRVERYECIKFTNDRRSNP